MITKKGGLSYVFSIFASIIYLIFISIIAYLVIKKAVKDAIRESREDLKKPL